MATNCVETWESKINCYRLLDGKYFWILLPVGNTYIYIYIYIYNYDYYYFAQSVGAVEYTDCFSAEG